MEKLDIINKWLERYTLYCNIQYGSFYALYSQWNHRQRIKSFPLCDSGLIKLCKYSKGMNQDIYRELPEFLTKKG